MQASREDIFPPLAGAKAPDPDAACGREASPKSQGNGIKRGKTAFVGFRKSAPTENERGNMKKGTPRMCSGQFLSEKNKPVFRR